MIQIVKKDANRTILVQNNRNLARFRRERDSLREFVETVMTSITPDSSYLLGGILHGSNYNNA